MELRFVDAIKNKDCLKNAKKLYSSAFPIAERILFFMLERACKKDRANFFGIYDAQTFAGIVYLVLVDDAALIFYFAVDEKLRGKGYGSAILSALKEKYPGTRIFLEIEKPDEHAKNNPERLRRKAFYERNGFVPCGFTTGALVTYDVLSYGGAVSINDYRKIMMHFGDSIIFDFVYKKLLKQR